MKKIIAFLTLIILIISTNNQFLYAFGNNQEELQDKISKVKEKQEITQKKYTEILSQVDNVIEEYQGKLDKKSDTYKEKNKEKINNNLQKVQQKKLEVITLSNKRLQESLEKNIAVENLTGKVNLEPNYLFELQENHLSNDEFYNQQWGIQNILGEYNNHSLLFEGEKILVAVIDTGIDFLQNDLSHTKWSREICYDENNELIDGGCLEGGYDFVDNDINPFPNDNYTHGNSVASLIAAKTNNNIGIASIANDNVEIMSLRTCCGESNYFGSENIARAIYFAVNNDAKIINASFGGPTYSKVIEDALIYARDHGVLVIAAAGNYASNNDTTPLYPASYDLDNIITVGSTSIDNNLAYFSNYGNQSVDIVAPGEKVYALLSNNTINTVNGTSFSTPFTTSLATRYLSQNPELTYLDIKDAIYSSAKINTQLSGKIKNNLQLQINPESVTYHKKNDDSHTNPGDNDTSPQNPVTPPADNSDNKIDEQYSKIMKQIAYFRQAKISENNQDSSITFQQLQNLEKDIEKYLYQESTYLEKRDDISAEKKLKYLNLLKSQLSLVKEFNTQIHSQTQTQGFGSLSQEEQDKNISDILFNIGVEPVVNKEPKILSDMSNFGSVQKPDNIEKITELRAIIPSGKQSFNTPMIQGFTPQQVVGVTTSDLGINDEIIINESIRSLAQELGYNPVNIFNYVRNNIDYEAYYGSKKSSNSCLEDKKCNDIDQTNLTIALMRASGIPARYQTSWILVPKENISKLMGTADLKIALYALRTAEIPAARVNSGQANFDQITDFDNLDLSEDQYIAIEWTRAQALIEYNHLGGNYTNDSYLDSSITQGELENKISQKNFEWISIDPSFVFHKVENNNQDVRNKNYSDRKDLLSASNLDISEFFKQYLKNSENTDVPAILKNTFIENIPVLSSLSGEELESQWNTYLYTKKTQQVAFDILPLAQAYTPVEVVRNGQTLQENIFSQLSENQKQYLEISLKRESNNEIVFQNIYTVDEVNNTPITLDYIGATDSDRQTIIDKGSLHLTPADLVDLVVSIDSQAEPISSLQTLPTVKIGEHLILNFSYKIGTEIINTSSKYSLGGNSEGIYMSFGPIPEDSMDTDSKVLLAGNWAIAKRYLQRITEYNSKLEKMFGSVNDLHYTRAVVTQNRVLNPIGDTATMLDFKGLSLDAHSFVKDYTLGEYSYHTSRSSDLRKLFGLYASEQEGQIFDDITGLTGISTTRGLQYAYSSPDYSVLEINSSNKTLVDTLGFSENTKQVMRDYIDEGRLIITPNTTVSNQNWQGIFYIALDEDGQGLYAIGENVVGNGGYTVDDITQIDESTNTAEFACAGNGNNTGLANTSTCRFIQTENTVNSCQGLYGKEDVNNFTDVVYTQGWDRNIHGELIGKMNYFGHSIVLSQNAIRFRSNSQAASEEVFDYWETCANMQSKVNEYLNIKNRPFAENFDKEKISEKVGTYMVWQPNQEIATYYTPEQKNNGEKGNVFEVKDLFPEYVGDFLTWLNTEFYHENKKILQIQLLGLPISEIEDLHINNKTVYYQDYQNGRLYIDKVGSYIGRISTYGEIHKYHINKINNGEDFYPTQRYRENNSYINQVFSGDIDVQFNKSTKEIKELPYIPYACGTGPEQTLEPFSYGLAVEMQNTIQGIGDFIVFASKINLYELYKNRNDIYNLIVAMYELNPSDLIEYMKLMNINLDNLNEIQRKIIEEYESIKNRNDCGARISYLGGRISGFFVPLSGLAKGIGNGTKSISTIADELKLVAHNTSPELPIHKRVDIIKTIPCALNSNGLQSITLQGKGPCIIDFEGVKNYIKTNGKLPPNYVTKEYAEDHGWISRDGNLNDILPGRSIGGNIFTVRPNQNLPVKPGRIWKEADIDYKGGYRNSIRLIYSNDGLYYKTFDHYKTFIPFN